MSEKDFPTVTRSPRSKRRRYDHVAYMERKKLREIPQTIEIEADTDQVVQSVFTAYDGAQEYTNSRDRAVGLLIRLMPLFLLLLVLTIGVGLLLVILTDIDGVWTIVIATLLFALMCLRSYSRESLRDYEFSRSGLERHRIDTATSLKEQELDYQFRLKRMLLEHHLRLLEAMEHDRLAD